MDFILHFVFLISPRDVPADSLVYHFEKDSIARCYGAYGIYAILLVIFHIALFNLRTAACKLSTDVGGPTYFLISFTSSRVRGDGERGNILDASFLSTSSTPLLLSGISTGSSRAINKRTRRSSQIAYRCIYSPTFRPVSFSPSLAHGTCPDLSIPNSVCA